MFIGNDLLPNVYISNIEVYDKKIRYDIFVIDSESNPTWSKKRSLTHRLMLKHVVTEDLAERRSISTGLSTFNKYHKNAVVDLVSTMHHGTAEDILDLEDRKYFIKTYEYELESQANNVTIFANLFIDDIPEEGPIAAEDVYINGSVPDTTNVFTRDGLQYYGSVHNHEGVYMEGKKHRSQAHKTVELLSAPNLKIKDLRSHSYPNKIGRVDKNVPLFSNLFVSFDKETKHNFMFFINLKEIIIQKSKHGKFFSMLDKEAETQILNRTLFRSIRINRHRLKNTMNSSLKDDKVAKTKIIAIGYEVDNEKADGFESMHGERVEFISHNFGSSIRGLRFFDSTLNDRVHGNFKYEVELSLYDVTRNFLFEIKNRADRTIQRVIDFLSFIDSKNRYDGVLNKIKNKTRENVFYQNQLHIETAVFFNNLKFMMYDITESEKQKDLIRNYSLINAETCSIRSLNIFLKESKLLYNKFLSICDFDTAYVRGNYQNNFVPTNKELHNRIVLNYKFKNVIKPTDSKYHFAIPEPQQEPEQGQEVTSETTSPTGFGARGQQATFGFTPHQMKFSEQVANSANKSQFSISSLSFTPNTQTTPPEQEPFKNITDYLGSDTKMNSFTTEEKCEITQEQSTVNAEIEEQVLTNTNNIQNTMSQVTIEKELLEGFRLTTSGKIILTEPNWNSSFATTDTAIIKQNRVGLKDEQTNYSYPDKYLLLNNTRQHIRRASYVSPLRPLAQIADQTTGVNSLFTQTLIIENYNEETPIDTTFVGLPQPQVTTNTVQSTSPAPQPTSMQPEQGSTMTVSTVTTSGMGGSY